MIFLLTPIMIPSLNHISMSWHCRRDIRRVAGNHYLIGINVLLEISTLHHKKYLQMPTRQLRNHPSSNKIKSRQLACANRAKAISKNLASSNVRFFALVRFLSSSSMTALRLATIFNEQPAVVILA
jgi:hypothetical protein